MVRPRAIAGRRPCTREYRAGSDRPGSIALCRSRRDDRADRGRAGLPSHRSGYRNCLLVEQPNGDFAQTIIRQLLYSAFADPFWRAACASGNAELAAIAGKAEKEAAYHLRHAAEWVVRLGDGTDESHRRAAAALDVLWRFTEELFETDAVEAELVSDGVIPDPGAIRSQWNVSIDAVLARATLARPSDGWMLSGGRNGRHSEHLGHLLAEMQSLHRACPGASW